MLGLELHLLCIHLPILNINLCFSIMFYKTQPPRRIGRALSEDTTLTPLSIGSSIRMPNLSIPKPVVLRNTSDGPTRRAPPRPPRVQKSRTVSVGDLLSRPPVGPKFNTVPMRPRANTRESRASTIGSTGSSHQRCMHFSFTPESLAEIHAGDPFGDDTSTIASADQEGPLDFDGIFDDDIDSPFQGLHKGSNNSDKHWFQDWLETGSLSSSAIHREGAVGVPPPEDDMQRAVSKWSPKHVYLPRCDRFETEPMSSISGWLAFSKGEKLYNHLKSGRLLSRSDIAYMKIHEDTMTMSLLRSTDKVSSDGTAVMEEEWIDFSCLPNAVAEMNVVSVLQGRCVIIKDTNTDRVLYTFMPVSLPEEYFDDKDGNLVGDLRFKSLSTDMFRLVDKSFDHVAPVAQHEATLHLMFGIDGWIRRANNE